VIAAGGTAKFVYVMSFHVTLCAAAT